MHYIEYQNISAILRSDYIFRQIDYFIKNIIHAL